jgi:hypothetical protein
MTDYGPIATAVGVFLAAIALYINGRRERRRKTLESCEKLVFDKDLRAHLSVENLLAPFFLDPRSSRLVSKKFIAEPLPELRKLFSATLPTVPPSPAEIDKISLRRP